MNLMQIYDVFHPSQAPTSDKPTPNEPSTSNDAATPNKPSTSNDSEPPDPSDSFTTSKATTSNEEPRAPGFDKGDWNLAKEALDQCFEQYSQTPREEGRLKFSYVFLILLRLVPVSQRASLANKAGSRLGKLLRGIRKEIDGKNPGVAKAAEELMDGMKEFTAQKASAQAREGSVSKSP